MSSEKTRKHYGKRANGDADDSDVAPAKKKSLKLLVPNRSLTAFLHDLPALTDRLASDAVELTKKMAHNHKIGFILEFCRMDSRTDDRVHGTESVLFDMIGHLNEATRFQVSVSGTVAERRNLQIPVDAKHEFIQVTIHVGLYPPCQHESCTFTSRKSDFVLTPASGKNFARNLVVLDDTATSIPYTDLLPDDPELEAARIKAAMSHERFWVITWTPSASNASNSHIGYFEFVHDPADHPNLTQMLTAKAETAAYHDALSLVTIASGAVRNFYSDTEKK